MQIVQTWTNSNLCGHKGTLWEGLMTSEISLTFSWCNNAIAMLDTVESTVWMAILTSALLRSPCIKVDSIMFDLVFRDRRFFSPDPDNHICDGPEIYFLSKYTDVLLGNQRN